MAGAFFCFTGTGATCYAVARMGKETYLQSNLFDRELVDTRTRKQKRQARAREGLQQTALFSQRDVAQFGVTARPLIPLPPHATFRLISDDTRTDEEIAAALAQAVLQRATTLPGLPHPLAETDAAQPGADADRQTDTPHLPAVLPPQPLPEPVPPEPRQDSALPATDHLLAPEAHDPHAQPLADLRAQIEQEHIDFWDNVPEIGRYVRTMAWKTLRRYNARKELVTETLADLEQIGWVSLLECKRTNQAMPKRLVTGRSMSAMRRYLLTDIFNGGMPHLRDYKGGENVAIFRFYELSNAPWHAEYGDDDIEHAFYYRADGSRIPVTYERETELAYEHQICEPLLESGIDQWLPNLEQDFYRILTALRLHKMNATNRGRQRLYFSTYRRYAFLLVCRLRGLTNAQIATISGRHSDPVKARTRVGSDVKLARGMIEDWLLLTPEERTEALTALQQQHPQYDEEPRYCATVARELIWSRFSYTIQALNGQSRPGEKAPEIPDLGKEYAAEVVRQNHQIAVNGQHEIG